jgi:hypothetical protein
MPVCSGEHCQDGFNNQKQKALVWYENPLSAVFPRLLASLALPPSLPGMPGIGPMPGRIGPPGIRSLFGPILLGS